MTRNERVTEACCQLWHTDVETRRHAASQLAQFGELDSVQHLEQAVDRERDPTMRDELSRALANLTS